jgi:hypothetical protein
MRRHLAMQALESGKGFFPNLMGPGGNGYAYTPGTMSLNADASSGKVGMFEYDASFSWL